MSLFQALAGLGRPVSPDGRQFAFYDPSLDQIILLALPDGTRVALPAGTRSGCWVNARQFAAASENDLRLFSGAQGSALLMQGLWLPRGSGPANDLVACTRGGFSRSFALVRMLILTSD
jgi:hypothetical protein